jgi:hypothetical protein
LIRDPEKHIELTRAFLCLKVLRKEEIMSAKIEAGKNWIIEKHGDFHLEKSGVLLPSGLLVASPAYLNGHLKQRVRLYAFGAMVEVFSKPAYSIISGHLPDEADAKGQVLYNSLSPEYGKTTLTLVGLNAEVCWGDLGSDNYIKVGNLVDLSGKTTPTAKNENLNREHVTGEIIRGSEVASLPVSLQQKYIDQVVEKLSESKWTKPQSVASIENAIRGARAIICHDLNAEELLAFGKLEYFGVNDAKQVIYEFGSWISFKGNGYGAQVLNAARDLAAEQFPYARLIAIVRPENLKAQNIITENDGHKVGYIGNEFKHVYDITRRQQPLNLVKTGPGGIWLTERNYQHII